MKKAALAAVIFAAAVFGALDAHAVAVKGWERPILRAQMNVYESTSNLDRVPNVELVMTQQDGRMQPTGFVLLIDGQAMPFEISKAQRDQCGSYRYLGTPVAERGHMSIQGVRLWVVDHSQRRCDSVSGRPGNWLASLQNMGQVVMNMSGNPEPVFTINR